MARCDLVYNSALFQGSGVAAPTDDWTYDQLAGAATRLTPAGGAEGDRWGGGRLLSGDVSLMAALRAFGGDLYSPDGKKTLIGSEGSPARRHLVARPPPQGPHHRAGARLQPAGPLHPGEGGAAAGLQPQQPGRHRQRAEPGRRPLGAGLDAQGPRRPARGLLLRAAHRPGPGVHAQGRGVGAAEVPGREGVGPRDGDADAHQRAEPAIFGPRPDVYADPRVLAAPGMPPGVMAACLRAMELSEPFTPVWNFRSADVRDVLNAELGKAVRGQVQADGGFFTNLEKLIQVVLDLPKRSAA